LTAQLLDHDNGDSPHQFLVPCSKKLTPVNKTRQQKAMFRQKRHIGLDSQQTRTSTSDRRKKMQFNATRA
jgi:hypothetical protein